MVLQPAPENLLAPSEISSAEMASCPSTCRQSRRDKARFSKETTIWVLHVINGQYYAGAERVQDLLAQYLPDWGFQVGFALLKPGQFLCQRRCQQTPVWPVPMGKRVDIRPAWRLARLIRQEGFRLLHAHTPRSLLVGSLAAWLAGAPLVYHVHSPAWADSTRWFFNWANAALEQVLGRRAKRVICVSGALADQMHRRGLPSRKIVVVPNGVPTPPSSGNRPIGVRPLRAPYTCRFQKGWSGKAGDWFLPPACLSRGREVRFRRSGGSVRWLCFAPERGWKSY